MIICGLTSFFFFDTFSFSFSSPVASFDSDLPASTWLTSFESSTIFKSFNFSSVFSVDVVVVVVVVSVVVVVAVVFDESLPDAVFLLLFGCGPFSFKHCFADGPYSQYSVGKEQTIHFIN